MKRVPNFLKPTVFGVGYIGGDRYQISVNHKHTKIYQLWHNLLNRCYNPTYHATHSTYADCTTVEEWHNFQNFAEWCASNYDPVTMSDWQLDKDILVANNKVYGPSTCCFVPKEINITIRVNVKAKNKLSPGIKFRNNRFLVFIGTGKRTYCGSFKTLDEAIVRYSQSKQQYITLLAYKYKDVLPLSVYTALINFKINN